MTVYHMIIYYKALHCTPPQNLPLCRCVVWSWAPPHIRAFVLGRAYVLSMPHIYAGHTAHVCWVCRTNVLRVLHNRSGQWVISTFVLGMLNFWAQAFVLGVLHIVHLHLCKVSFWAHWLQQFWYFGQLAIFPLSMKLGRLSSTIDNHVGKISPNLLFIVGSNSAYPCVSSGHLQQGKRDHTSCICCVLPKSKCIQL